MKINVGQLEKIVGSRQSFHFILPVDTVCSETDNFWLVGKITVDGEVVNTGIRLLVNGTVRAKASQSCHRCLKQFERNLEIPFTEIYRETSDSVSAEQDGDILSYHGDELDIKELIRETLLLAEPIKALCSDDCQGICQKCGVDRNVSSCSCGTQTIDPRLAALRQLFDTK